MTKSYNDAARERIKRSVLQTEKRRTRDIVNESRRLGAGQQLTAAVAIEDIEHKEFGDVELAAAGSFDSTFFGNSDRTITVYNPDEKIWSGSELFFLTASLSGTAFASDGIKSVVFQAFSATEIVGTAAAGIAAGTTGTLSSLEPLDGHFADATLQATLPAGAEDIEAGAAVFARLTYDPVGSYWRVVSGAAAAGGGGSYQYMLANYGDTAPSFTPDTYVSPDDSGPSPVSWVNSSVVGSVSGATFDAANSECVYDAGNYLLTAEMSCDNPDGDVQETGGRYPSGHPSEGQWKLGACRYNFQAFRSGQWVDEPKNSYAYPGPSPGSQTVCLRQNLTVESGESPLIVRLVVRSVSIDSSDARTRIFDGSWWTEKF